MLSGNIGWLYICWLSCISNWLHTRDNSLVTRLRSDVGYGSVSSDVTSGLNIRTLNVSSRLGGVCYLSVYSRICDGNYRYSTVLISCEQKIDKNVNVI